MTMNVSSLSCTALIHLFILSLLFGKNKSTTQKLLIVNNLYGRKFDSLTWYSIYLFNMHQSNHLFNLQLIYELLIVNDLYVITSAILSISTADFNLHCFSDISSLDCIWMCP